MKIKRRKSDMLYSLYIRRKANWKCEACGKQYEEGAQGLHASHFWGRAAESVRFDDENVSAHCFSCHQKFTANPEMHRQWKIKQLGEERYKILMVRAHTTRKRDDKLQEIIAKELLASLQN